MHIRFEIGKSYFALDTDGSYKPVKLVSININQYGIHYTVEFGSKENNVKVVMAEDKLFEEAPSNLLNQDKVYFLVYDNNRNLKVYETTNVYLSILRLQSSEFSCFDFCGHQIGIIYNDKLPDRIRDLLPKGYTKIISDYRLSYSDVRDMLTKFNNNLSLLSLLTCCL